jgi:hypothetical protein
MNSPKDYKGGRPMADSPQVGQMAPDFETRTDTGDGPVK